MRTPSPTGLLRFALAALVVVAVVSLAASLPLITGGEGVGLPQLRGLPTLTIDPELVVWIFGFGSVILLLVAFLIVRPLGGRRSIRGILPLVVAMSVLVVMSFLVLPSNNVPEGPTDGDTSGGGSDDAGPEDPTDDPGLGGGSEDGEGPPAGEGEGDGGEGAEGGEPGGAGPTTPGADDPGAGEDGTGGGSGGEEGDVPSDNPGGTGDGATGPGSGGDIGNPGTIWEQFLGSSPVVAGVLLLIFGFVAFVAVHLLRATVRTRRALAEAEGLMPSETLRGEVLAALENAVASGREGTVDVRSAILASYGVMIHLFQSRGLRAGQHLTAREVEMLALKSLGLSAPATRELRRLFEEARYSEHPLGDDERREALESLRRVRHELAA